MNYLKRDSKASEQRIRSYKTLEKLFLSCVNRKINTAGPAMSGHTHQKGCFGFCFSSLSINT